MRYNFHYKLFLLQSFFILANKIHRCASMAPYTWKIIDVMQALLG